MLETIILEAFFLLCRITGDFTILVSVGSGCPKRFFDIVEWLYNIICGSHQNFTFLI